MTDPAFHPAIKTALRIHEIGNQTPYKLYFAAKGKSGASFGFMQGDLAAGQAVVTKTFKDVLKAEGFTAPQINSLVSELSVHLMTNPLSSADTNAVNAALKAQSALVDAMDDVILQDVLEGVDLCIAAADEDSRSIDPRALLYMALWINMSGKPTKLLTWLSGNNPQLGVPVASATNPVTSASIRNYLLATSYYRANPGNVAHLDDSVAQGAAVLPHGSMPFPGLVATATSPAVLSTGWELRITRQSEQSRGVRKRTIGTYEIFHDGISTGIGGTAVETKGPGDNTVAGNGRRVEAGTYPLATQAGSHYVTLGYVMSTDSDETPKPGIELLETGNRQEILIHPGHGFLASVGCINLTDPLPNGNDDIDFVDSRDRVITAINDLRAYLGGGFPHHNGQKIGNARVVIGGLA